VRAFKPSPSRPPQISHLFDIPHIQVCKRPLCSSVLAFALRYNVPISGIRR
jgi:hypothetical protein